MKKSSIIIVLSLVLALTASACSLHIGGRGISGSGNVVTETRQVAGFDRVQLDGFGRLILTQGTSESLQIEAEDNLIERITTEVRGGTLYIGWKAQGWENSVTPTEPVIFHLNVMFLRGLDVNGAAEIESASLTTPQLDITVDGAAKINIDNLTTDSLHATFSGGATCHLSGKAADQEVTISGAGEYDAGDLESQTVHINVSGAGTLTVWAVKSLAVKGGGVTAVKYYGSPDVQQDLSGLTAVNALGNK
jgi:hypothetical protein